MVDAPEKIWAVASLGMVGTGRWVTQGSENPHGNVEYTRSDLIAELAAENERLKRLNKGLHDEVQFMRKAAKENRDRYEALASTDAVKVKTLEWHGPFKPGENSSHYNHIYADSVLGRYTFDWKGWKKFDPPTSTDCPGDFFYTARDLEDAKAAAQADYERRILSALEPHPRATNTVDAHETANVSDKPEDQQEPVAWITNIGWVDNPRYTVSFEGDKTGCENFPVYTRPSEQAVTETMVEAALEKFGQMFASSMQYPSETDTVGSIRHHIMRSALKAAMEAGR